jgi:NAD(P)-dependent dehydrogenase (short-subunit alcohol dehydrogenase family)
MALGAGKLAVGLLLAFLAYDHLISEDGNSHVSGIASFSVLTVDALTGKSPACTMEGNWLIYKTLFGEAFTKNTETAGMHRLLLLFFFFDKTHIDFLSFHVYMPEEIAVMHETAGTQLYGKVIIVTGASNGIGVETARVLMLQGVHVIFAVRNVNKGEMVAKQIKDTEGAKIPSQGKATVMACDLSSLRSVKSFAQAFFATGLPLHQIINNAGIMVIPEFTLTEDGFEKQWGVDHLGHFLLTELLLPKLQETGTVLSPARIINLGSTAHYTANSLEPSRDLPPPQAQYNPTCAYGVAKMSNMLYTVALQQKFKADAQDGKKTVLAIALHPGVIHTGLGRENKGFTRVFWETGIVAPMSKTIGKFYIAMTKSCGVLELLA